MTAKMQCIGDAIVLFDNFQYQSFGLKKAENLNISLYSLKHIQLFGIIKASKSGAHWQIVKDPYKLRD